MDAVRQILTIEASARLHQRVRFGIGPRRIEAWVDGILVEAGRVIYRLRAVDEDLNDCLELWATAGEIEPIEEA